jgi:5'-3' exonuclease
MGKYDDLLNKVQPSAPRKVNDHILVIDALNTFIRSFTMINMMNPQGAHVGGMVGFLKSLGFLTRTFNPTRVVIVFDGPGSSAARKNINSDYKANRDITRITNWEIFDKKDDEYASMSAQIERLVEYLQMLPVDMISMPKVEADDVIAYIGQQFGDNNKVTIVSSDKDFLQIVDENVEVYSPIKKKIYGPAQVKEEVGVLAENYLVMKSLLGDNSDNLPGVKGLGPKGIFKHFPDLIDKPGTDLEYVFEICEAGVEKTKIFQKILTNYDRVWQNHDLMNLMEPRLSDTQKVLILDMMDNCPSQLNVMAFLLMLKQDSIEHGITKNTESWLENFRYLLTVKK